MCVLEHKTTRNRHKAGENKVSFKTTIYRHKAHENNDVLMLMGWKRENLYRYRAGWLGREAKISP